MGQKVNPHGARVGVIFNWSTRWYAGKKDFANNLVEDYKLREILLAGVPAGAPVEDHANASTMGIYFLAHC